MIFNTSFFDPVATVSIYGAGSETITITPSEGAAISVTTDANGYGGIKTLPLGVYTVYGSKSKTSKIISVTGSTTQVTAFPTGYVPYFWNGYKVTGGFTTSGYTDGHTIAGSAGVSATQVYAAVAATNYRASIVGTAQAHDLTNIKTVKFLVDSAKAPSWVVLGVSKSKSVSCGVETGPNIVSVEPGSGSDSVSNVTASVNVSSLTGNYYIYVLSWRYDYYSSNVYVSRIWGEQ